MSYDIATVSAAMDRKIRQLDHIAHNLANVKTAGFKAQHLHALAQLDAPSGGLPSEPELFVDFSQGVSEKTGNPLDLSLRGDGFFVVQTPEGPAFTRKGDFMINARQQLATQEGYPVLGENGPLVLRGSRIEIGGDGVVQVDDETVGTLRIVDFANRKVLRNAGAGLFADPGTAGLRKVERPTVAAGYLELSNVNAIREMAQMIDLHRSFETYQKVIQSLSDQDKLSTSRVGRVG